MRDLLRFIPRCISSICLFLRVRQLVKFWARDAMDVDPPPAANVVCFLLNVSMPS